MPAGRENQAVSCIRSACGKIDGQKRRRFREDFDQGRYALRLMIDVAVHGGEEFVSLKDVAARQGISMKYLEQIAGLLGKADSSAAGVAPWGISSDESAEEYTWAASSADRKKSGPGGLPGRRRRTPASGAASARPWTSGRAAMRL